MELPVQSPVFLIEVDKIKPNPQQPRKFFDEENLRELAASIREVGLLQPIVVTKIEQETESGTSVEYQLIAGERRLMACKLLGLERIPSIVKSVNLDRERLELAIVENIQRADLNPIEAARAFSRLQDEFNLTQREIAARVGKSREVIANSVRLLSLPTEIQDAVSKNLLSESQGRLLLAIENPAQQQTLFNDILRDNLTVREVRARIQKLKGAASETEASLAPSGRETSFDPELSALQKELESALGTKVKLEKSHANGGGRITIAFYSPEELQGIIGKLVNRNDTPPPSPLSEFSI